MKQFSLKKAPTAVKLRINLPSDLANQLRALSSATDVDMDGVITQALTFAMGSLATEYIKSDKR